MKSTVMTFKMSLRHELCLCAHIMVDRLRPIDAARFIFSGKIADEDIGLGGDLNLQGFGVGFLVEGSDIGIVAQAVLNFYGDMDIK
jgi:hypothetical protein